MDSVKWLRKVEVLTEAKNESYLRLTRTGANRAGYKDERQSGLCAARE